MEEKVKNDGKRKGVIVAISVLSVCLMTITITYAYFTSQLNVNDKEYVTVKNGTLSYF